MSSVELAQSEVKVKQIVFIDLSSSTVIAREVEDAWHTILLKGNSNEGARWGKYNNTVEPRYLELAYFELPLISK